MNAHCYVSTAWDSLRGSTRKDVNRRPKKRIGTAKENSQTAVDVGFLAPSLVGGSRLASGWSCLLLKCAFFALSVLISSDAIFSLISLTLWYLTLVLGAVLCLYKEHQFHTFNKYLYSEGSRNSS